MVNQFELQGFYFSVCVSFLYFLMLANRYKWYD